MRALLRSLASDLADLVAPYPCVACGAPHPDRPRGVSVLCALCHDALLPAEDPPPGVLVPYAHGGPLARAIHRAKYGDRAHTARRLGLLLAHSIGAAITRVDVVVPVPLHPTRLMSRGYNQAAEMARALPWPRALDAVERVRDTPSQVGRGKRERFANVCDAFAVRDVKALRGKHVLIVDDVVTTGATLRAVRAVVCGAGAREVTCLALARAPFGT